MLKTCALLAALVLATPAAAHDFYDNGGGFRYSPPASADWQGYVAPSRPAAEPFWCVGEPHRLPLEGGAARMSGPLPPFSQPEYKLATTYPICVAHGPPDRSHRRTVVRHHGRVPAARALDRGRFLEAVAESLRGREIGDGAVYLAISEAQRKFRDPPLDIRAGQGRWAR